jgi:hypothetical protein
MLHNALAQCRLKGLHFQGCGISYVFLHLLLAKSSSSADLQHTLQFPCFFPKALENNKAQFLVTTPASEALEEEVFRGSRGGSGLARQLRIPGTSANNGYVFSTVKL